jgi:S1-C subfamily serine protease
VVAKEVAMDAIGRRSGMAVRGIVLSGLVALAVVGPGVLASGRSAVTAGGATLSVTQAPDGLIVTSLETGGASTRAGLRVGDVIDRVDGAGTPTPDMLLGAESAAVARLHVAARGDGVGRTLIWRRPTEGQGEDPDRRGR